MESETNTPQFTVGQEIATFLVSGGLLPKVWEDSRHANNSEGFTLNEHEDFVCVAFASFQRVEDFIFNQSKCGEDNIQTVQNVFSGCLNPALIHPGALTMFLHIMEKTDLQAKLQIYTDSKQRKLKPIIFVGHSIGGAIATLATLWFLGKRLRQISPFCITFGCPLVGNERLVEAVGRENWGGNFCHVVSKHDIVPRMLLAPVESIAKPFTTICSYWQGINVPDSLIQDAARTLLNQIFVSPSSPYRPFGTYMLCSSNGAACIQNAQTVLEMLSLTMPSQQTSLDEIVQACLSEHIRYDSVLEEVLQNSIRGIRSIENSNSESPYEMGILLQLEAIGVGAQNDDAQGALRKAGEIENSFLFNVDKLATALSLKQSLMAEIEWYKEGREKNGGIGYYDTFKNHASTQDIHVDRHRINLGAFWDGIIEAWEGNELPSDFQSQNKWINAGTAYRRLVEPLDIADYYRMSKGKGNYLSDGRPNRYKVLQEWMEAKEKTRSSRGQRSRGKPASLTEDSCFWAYVEEAWKDLENLKQGQHQSLQCLEKFEEYVTKMEKNLSISRDVFSEGSSFMMWWKEWKAYKKNQSPDWSSSLSQIMENFNVSFEHSMTWSRALKTYERDPWSPPCESSTSSNILTIGGFTVGQEIVQPCLSEHIRYDSVLEEVLQNSIRGIRSIENSNSESPYEMGILLQLGAQDDLGQLALRRGEVRNAYDQIDDSHLLIQLSQKQATLAELEWYKEVCEKTEGITYYDSFKNQNDSKSIKADCRRLKLAEFWDEIIERWESHELPSDFETQNKWINAGTAYRRLVEPLDIAFYYSKGKGNYLSDGRPRRHKVLQEWMEAKEKTRSSRVQGRRTKPASLPRDSCFWAHIEEALKDLESLKQGQHQKVQNLENFEVYVTKMGSDLSISSDVFFEGSSFMMWWEEWKEYKKNQSPDWSSSLSKMMESENPFKFEGIDSSTVAQEKISSTGEVKESIPSNKGSDLAQLSSKESELIPQQVRMFELEWYKMICHENGDGYYDSFKNRNDKDYGDSNTNLLRVTLNEFWDGIIGICNSPPLPGDFQSRNKWINVGTAYRKLVEPLDIAQYYSTSKDSGNYLDKRPARYKVLEQWLEQRKTNRSSRDQRSRTKLPFLTRDSCFWACVEEALKDLKEGADQKKESLENFEKYVTEMIKDCKISSDVFLDGSSFMKWWRDYKEHQTSEWKLKSPLYNLKSPFWKP